VICISQYVENVIPLKEYIYYNTMEEFNSDKTEKELLHDINAKLNKIINLIENINYLYEKVKFPLNWVFQKIDRSPKSVINDQD